MSEFVSFFKELGKNNSSVAGGKGAQLGEMLNAGIPVPDGFVVLTHSFNAFIDENGGLREKIVGVLSGVDAGNTESVEGASKEIRGLLSEGVVPKQVENSVLNAFRELGAEFVAVRSSATAEDASNASWAGELETYLNVTKETLLSSVKRCWSSLFTSRAIFYRIEKKLVSQDIAVGVVVQKMIFSEVSGVVFTVHPVSKDSSQLVIEAGYGLGEAIVSGAITPDNYVVDKNDLVILDVSITEQEKAIRRLEGGGTEWFEVSFADRRKQKLSGQKIIELTELCKEIEEHYGVPQDIEWALEKNVLYITQSRPITTL